MSKNTLAMGYYWVGAAVMNFAWFIAILGTKEMFFSAFIFALIIMGLLFEVD